MIKIKRIYEKRERGDGLRIFVDRMWPRGMRREDAQIDLWLKDIAPSNELRQWFDHDPKKWTEFKKRYFEELKNNRAFFEVLPHVNIENITLLYGARDETHNNAVALKEYLERKR